MTKLVDRLRSVLLDPALVDQVRDSVQDGVIAINGEQCPPHALVIQEEQKLALGRRLLGGGGKSGVHCVKKKYPKGHRCEN